MKYSLEASLLHKLHRASQVASDLFASEPGDHALTPRQLAVLTAIAENEGLSQTRIVERTGIDRSTLADVIRRLQKCGLLTRKRTKEDARAYAVRITPEGHRALREAGEIAVQAEARILAALPVRHRQELIRLLDALTDSQVGAAKPNS